MKVTAIIPCRNNCHTINSCLQCLVMGTRVPDWIIIADDDSDDATYERLCKDLRVGQIEHEGAMVWPPKSDCSYKRVPITIFRKQRSTVANTINTAIKMSFDRTDCYAFVDPNDEYGIDKIEKSVAVMERDPSVACVVSDCFETSLDGKIKYCFRNPSDIVKLHRSPQYDLNCLVSKKAFMRLKGLFDDQLDFWCEYDLMLRLLGVGIIHHIAEPLHSIRTVERSDRENKNRELIQNAIIGAAMGKHSEK